MTGSGAGLGNSGKNSLAAAAGCAGDGKTAQPPRFVDDAEATVGDARLGGVLLVASILLVMKYQCVLSITQAYDGAGRRRSANESWRFVSDALGDDDTAGADEPVCIVMGNGAAVGLGGGGLVIAADDSCTGHSSLRNRYTLCAAMLSWPCGASCTRTLNTSSISMRFAGSGVRQSPVHG